MGSAGRQAGDGDRGGREEEGARSKRRARGGGTNRRAAGQTQGRSETHGGNRATRPGGTGDGRMEHEESGVGAQTKQPRQVWQGAPDGVGAHNKSATLDTTT